jgi:outer membrane protein assembly factor BamB
VAQYSGPAFTITAAREFPASVDANLGGGLAAVAGNVAYFMTAGSCPPDSPNVTAIDLRTGRLLWSVLVPQIPCTSPFQSAWLLPYDNGFAVRTTDGHLLLYR